MKWMTLCVLTGLLGPSLGLANDTSKCAFKIRDPMEKFGDYGGEALSYLVRTNKKPAVLCMNKNVLTLSHAIYKDSIQFGVDMQRKYEPNYPQSTEFPNHAQGFIETGSGSGDIYLYPHGDVQKPCGVVVHYYAKNPWESPPRVNPDKGIQNAARHSVLGCLLTAFCGRSPAEDIMEGHEEYSNVDGDEDSRCDVWNNSHGLEAGERIHSAMVTRSFATIGKSPACEKEELVETPWNDVASAFDFSDPPNANYVAKDILTVNDHRQYEFVKKNCERAVESKLRSGHLCIDRPKPDEKPTYRKPTGKLVESQYKSCKASPSQSQSTSTAPDQKNQTDH